MWTTPLIASLPPWWRFLQCLRRYHDSGEKVHLMNAAKYSSSILATVVTALRRMYREYKDNDDGYICSPRFSFLSRHGYGRHLHSGMLVQFLLYILLGYQDGLGSFTTGKSTLFVT